MHTYVVCSDNHGVKHQLNHIPLCKYLPANSCQRSGQNKSCQLSLSTVRYLRPFDCISLALQSGRFDWTTATAVLDEYGGQLHLYHLDIITMPFFTRRVRQFSHLEVKFRNFRTMARLPLTCPSL